MLAPQDAAVARRVPPPLRHAYPTAQISLSRDALPVQQHGDIGPADPIRYSEWYAHGKPFPLPGMSLAFTFSPQQWEDPPPLGFVRRAVNRMGIATPRGQQSTFGRDANIEPAPAVAYGSLFGTFAPYASQMMPGMGEG